uniref:Uncharacterized protein n=1 Tax=Anguilla anguilla TaxID=7936 RepID=A0A0E9UNS2_ANGAN
MNCLNCQRCRDLPEANGKKTDVDKTSGIINVGFRFQLAP